MNELTHFNEAGHAHMVDVADKAITLRVARAEGRIHMQADTLALIMRGGHRKGDVLGIARVAGIMAAKKTAELIPLCHPLALTHIVIDLAPMPDQQVVYCQARVETRDRTGVEMEALTAVQIAMLTVTICARQSTATWLSTVFASWKKRAVNLEIGLKRIDRT